MRRAIRLAFFLLLPLLAVAVASSASSAKPGSTSQPQPVVEVAPPTAQVPWGAGGLLFALDADAAVLSWYSATDRYFYSEMQDTVGFEYRVSQAANITSTVVDSQGHTVRVLEQVSRTAGTRYWVSWDGRDDQGAMVPDGEYTVHVVGENQAGPTNEITVRVVVDTRAPGALTVPEPGDVVSGSSVRWVFTPTEGFDLTYVSVWCDGGGGGSWAETPGADGTFSSTMDVTWCTNGDNQVSGWVEWKDPFGRSQSSYLAPVPATVMNAPVLALDPQDAYFYPGADGQGEFSAWYRLSQSANITSTVVDSQGHTVRVLEQGLTRAAGGHSVDWDGRDDQGATVPDGVYTVHVVGKNQVGSSNEITVRAGVDTRVPGALTSPEPGVVVSGTSVRWVFTPTEGFDVTSVDVYCSYNRRSSVSVPDADGTFSSTVDVTGCANGDNQVSGWVSWRDPFEVRHSWSFQPVPVTVVNVPVLSWYETSERYFSPDGDGQNDLFEFKYNLSQPANITSTVVDPQGQTVRVLEQGISLNDGVYSVSWDGRDDQGRVVPDGVYTVRVVGENQAGLGNEITVRAGVDTRTPGALTTPEPGAVVSGSSVRWVFTPTDGFTVSSVTAGCSANRTTASAPGPDGTFSSTVDVTSCANGDNQFSGSVSWRDPFGASQSWSFQPVPVTVVNVPVLSWYWTSEQYFSPDGDGQNDSFEFRYNLSQPANITSTVVDPQGQTVRVLEQGVAREASNYDIVVSWDGRDDQGQVVPDGVYAVHVVGENQVGLSNEITVRAGVDTRVPGALTTPEPGVVVSGSSVRWVFTPTEGFDLTSVSVGCYDGGGYSSAYAPGADGTFSQTMDVTSCANGDNPVSGSVLWRDPFGAWQSWSFPLVPVTVVNAAVLSWHYYYGAEDRYFSPGDDWQNESFSFEYWLSHSADITSTVVDPQGQTVRVLEQGVSRDATSRYGYGHSVSWDGRDDQGQVVPDGVYTVHVVGENQAGPTNEITVRAVVDTRIPGTLTTPAPGDVVSGASVRWVFTPTEGFDVAYVEVWCLWSSGYSPGSAYAPGADGTFTSTMDTTRCANGDNQVSGWVQWKDPFGGWHSSHLAPVPVTVVNAPVLSWQYTEDRYFSPGGDGPNARFQFAYDLSQPAIITLTVVDSQGQTVRVLEQGVSYGAGTSWVYWDGRDDQGQVVPDGVYTVHVVGENEVGSSNEITVRAGVDTRAPGAMTVPAPGDTLAGLVSFVFVPTSGFAVQSVRFRVSTGDSVISWAPMADGTWRTSVLAEGLGNGPAEVTATVYWTDPFGAQQEWTTPPHAVVIDNTSIPLAVSATPGSGQAPLTVELTIDTSDPQGRPVTYTVDYGDGTSTVTDTSATPYPTVTLSHTYTKPGAYQVVVMATNGEGASAVQRVSVVAEGKSNSPPVVEVAANPSSGTAPLLVAFAIDATDDDGDALTYTIDFGDKSAVAKGTVVADPVEHTYTAPGTYMARTEVSDGQIGIVRFTRITVVLSEPLVAVAGEPLRAVAGETVWFDASASRPSVAISQVTWEFGDGTTGTGWQPSHVYTKAGNYMATVTVYVGEATATASTTVTVTAPVPFAGVEVTVRGESNLLQGATATHIAADGARIQAVSGPDGVARLVGVADGTWAVYVTAPGYLPVAGEVVVTDGHGSLDTTLVSGDISATTLEHRQLSLEEVVDLGIDTDDPANQNVFYAQVHLGVMPGGGGTPAPNVTLAYNGSGEVVYVSGSGLVQGSASYWATPTIITVGSSARAVQWMIVPVKGGWLKEFFEVRLVVQNLTSSPFSFDDGEARLDLPEGLSLAPTGEEQSLAVSVPDIPGGGSETVSWVLRGDVEGDYDLTATYSAVLGPVGEPVYSEAKTDRPLKVWGGSAVEWSVRADPDASALKPFRITLTMTNVTPEETGVTVYNSAFEVFEGRGYLMAPETEYAKTVPVLYPGQKAEAEFIFYSRLDGDVNVSDPGWEQSFVLPTAGNVDPATSGITLHPESTERLDVASAWIDMPDQVAEGTMGLAIRWEEVDGVTDYALWGRESLDEGEWALVTEGVYDGLPSNTRVIKEDSDQVFRYYTVISHLPDETTKPTHVIERRSDMPVHYPVPVEEPVDQCYDVLMLSVAGSGQAGMRAEPLDALSAQLEKKLTGPDGPYRSFRSVYLDYPAVGVERLFSSQDDESEFFAGVDEGTESLEEFLDSRFVQCPHEKLVLGGYSQGALVVTNTLDDDEWSARTGSVPYERFGAIFLVANPANNPDFGGKKFGTAGPAFGLKGLGNKQVPSELSSLAYTLCNEGDIVCAPQWPLDVTADDVWGVLGGGTPTVLHGIDVHTTYQSTTLRDIRKMANGAAHHLLGMPVPKDDGYAVSTRDDSPFSTLVEVKYLRDEEKYPGDSVAAVWELEDECAPYVSDAPKTSPLPELSVSPVPDSNVSAEVSGTAPPGYFVCPIVVTGEFPVHQRTIDISIKSGWAAVAAEVRPYGTIDPDNVMQSVTVQVVDADGNPVPGAEVYFRLTGSATFPDGSQVQLVITDEQGLAVSTTPLPVVGQSGPATLSAEVPGLEPVLLASQDEVIDPGEGEAFATVPVPTVSGTVQVGQTLTVDPGVWEPEPDRWEFQWLRDGEPIDGATGPSYTLTAADLGRPVAVTATGVKAGYVTQAQTSQATGPVTPAVLTATPTPTVSGTAQVGQVLTADAGTWEPVPVTLAYQWLRDGTPIEGASDATYILVADDADHQVSVQVTGSAPGYADATVTSEPVLVAPGDPGEPGDEVFTSVPVPVVSGSAQVGQVLTAEPGAWEPEPDRWEFQWLRDGTPIEGATAPSYTLTAADLGHLVAVTVTGVKAGYVTQAKTSQATQAVAPAVLTPTPTPTLAGAARVGQLLTADAGRWEPVSVTLTYQWLRDGTPIDGATDATYLLVAADADTRVSVRVTGSAPGYADGVVESESVLVAPSGNGNGSNNGNGTNNGNGPTTNNGNGSSNGNGPGTNSGNGNGSSNGNGPGTNNGNGNGSSNGNGPTTNSGNGNGASNGNGPTTNSGNGNGASNGNGPTTNNGNGNGPGSNSGNSQVPSTGVLDFADDRGVDASAEGSADPLGGDAGVIADSSGAGATRWATVAALWLMSAAGAGAYVVGRRLLGSQVIRHARSPR